MDDIIYLLGLGNSYHICIFFNFVCYLHVTAQKIKVYNLQQADYVKMKELLAEIIWTEVVDPLDINYAWNYFSEKFNIILQNCVSLFTSDTRKNICMAREAIHLKSHKNKLWKCYTMTRSSCAYDRYHITRNQLRKLTRNLRKQYEIKLDNIDTRLLEIC